MTSLEQLPAPAALIEVTPAAAQRGRHAVAHESAGREVGNAMAAQSVAHLNADAVCEGPTP